jgi:hypothetical protein
MIVQNAVKPNFSNSQSKRIRQMIAVMAVLFLIISFIYWGFWPARGNADVKVVFSHFENVPGGQIAVFEVSNRGKMPVTMYGYGHWPFSLIAWYNGTNWDLDSSPSFDFSQSKPIVVPPGAKLPMPTFLPELDRWVVGVQYSTAACARLTPSQMWRFRKLEDFFRTRMKAAWSDPITLSSKPSNIVAPLGTRTNLITVHDPKVTLHANPGEGFTNH